MKNMIFSVCFFIIFMFDCVQSLHQSQERFYKESSHCYDLITDRSPPHGNKNTYKIGIKYQNYSRSMETFINLVEMIEVYYANKNKNLNAERLIRMLLKRYHIDGLYIEKFNVFEVKKLSLMRDQLTDILIGSNVYEEELNNNVFSEEEHCVLHYMLSRFVMPLSDVQFNLENNRDNRLNLVSNVEEAFNEINKFRINSKSMQFRNTDNGQKFDFYEQGVVRFRNSESDAIEVSRVLIGLLIGLTNNLPKLNNFEIFQKLKSIEKIKLFFDDNHQELKKIYVDTLLMLTLADIWATSLDYKNNGQVKLGKDVQVNSWNNQICPIVYQWQTSYNNNSIKLDSNGYSLAQLRGGLDGLRLGYTFKNKKFPKNFLKLSQILKMYYSNVGIAPIAYDASICTRSNLFDLFSKPLLEPEIEYAQLSVLYLTKSKIVSKSDLTAALLENRVQFESKLMDASSLSDENARWCMSSNRPENNVYRSSNSIYNANAYRGLNNPYGETSLNSFNSRNQKYSSARDKNQFNIETNNDLIFMVDFSISLNNQLNIINKILGSITMYNKETVTILSNRPGKNENEDGLDIISWRSTIKEKPLCQLKILANATDSQLNNEITKAGDLIDRITFMLNKFKNEQHKTMVAGKIFILFNFGFIKYDQSQEFLAAKRNIYIKHRDVKFLVIGQGDRNDLRNLIDFQKNSDENVFTDNVDLLSFNVNKLILENSAIITYKKCNIKESRFEEVAESNFVTPNSVKYFILGAQYFAGSTNLELRFNVYNKRRLKVCLSRRKFDFNENSQDVNCKNTSEHGNSFEFYLGDTCNGYSSEQCSSIYLAIYGLPDETISFDCKEPDCLNLEQIKFEFSHKEMICNSSIRNYLDLKLLICFIFMLYFVRNVNLTGKIR